MDFSLNEEQRRWQNEARHFAKEVLLPASLKRDQIEGGFEPWDWDIIKAGSKLGFRTFAVPKDLGGHGADFVTQGIVMAELAKADSAMSKAFSQNWKWSHLIGEFCTKDQKDRFLTPFLKDDTYVIGSASTEPNAGSDNRFPPLDDKSAGFRLKAEQENTKAGKDGDWILNGDKCFIANGSVGKLFFINARSDFSTIAREGTTVFMVPLETPGFRIGKIFNKATRACRMPTWSASRTRDRRCAAVSPPNSVTSNSPPTRWVFAMPPPSMRCSSPKKKSARASCYGITRSCS